MCQNEKEGRVQVEMVGQLVRITGEARKFIKWSDILDSAWDSPELCKAALVLNKFVIGHWDDLSILHNKFRRGLDHFLKSIFTDEMNHNHMDKIMSQNETYCLLVCGYQVDDKNVDIFSCLIFEYLDPDIYFTPTGIVYITSTPMFSGLKLAPLMLCILLRLFLFQHCSCILFASISPINEDWYVSHLNKKSGL